MRKTGQDLFTLNCFPGPGPLSAFPPVLQEMLPAQDRLIQSLRKSGHPIECQQSQCRSRRSRYEIKFAVRRNALGIEHFGKTLCMVKPFLVAQELTGTNERIHDGGLACGSADSQ